MGSVATLTPEPDGRVGIGTSDSVLPIRKMYQMEGKKPQKILRTDVTD